MTEPIARDPITEADGYEPNNHALTALTSIDSVNPLSTLVCEFIHEKGEDSERRLRLRAT
jgi:hypothetical protein